MGLYKTSFAPAALLALCSIMACGGESPDNESARSSAVYNPCGELNCGEPCSLCAPDDFGCVETAVLKVCQEDGTCSASVPMCEPPAPSCDDIECGPGEHCELEEVVCITWPCPPVPVCVANECPDPNDPSVHYIGDSDQDPSICLVVLFACDENQTLFTNECGCGCIDNEEPPPPPPPADDSCEDNCGGNAGSCWCDENCSSFGDCCDDYADFCEEPPPETDCRTDGCGEGEWCSFCWGTFECIPDGAVC